MTSIFRRLDGTPDRVKMVLAEMPKLSKIPKTIAVVGPRSAGKMCAINSLTRIISGSPWFERTHPPWLSFQISTPPSLEESPFRFLHCSGISQFDDFAYIIKYMKTRGLPRGAYQIDSPKWCETEDPTMKIDGVILVHSMADIYTTAEAQDVAELYQKLFEANIPAVVLITHSDHTLADFETTSFMWKADRENINTPKLADSDYYYTKVYTDSSQPFDVNIEWNLLLLIKRLYDMM